MLSTRGPHNIVLFIWIFFCEIPSTR
uniref:Uncharacterized protein n=1 Tax=Anguilla anguilla TaxID=7936 RepID=A0A0E9QW65_ANGAN